MKKRIFSRVLALFMAVSLLSTTAFAASFADLQNAINGTGGTADAPEYYGRDEGATEGGIAAWNQDGNRNVHLNENVERKDISSERFTTITVGGRDKTDVILDLNGNSIINNYKEEADQSKGQAPTVSPITVKGDSTSLTITDNSEKKDGAIIGNTQSWSSGIKVTDGAKLTLENGTVKGHTASGVVVEKDSTFEMTGGSISNNSKGGVVITDSAFSMSNGTISENNNSGMGGGVSVNNSSFIMTGGSIIKNEAANGGGGIYGASNSEIKLTGTEDNPIIISENKTTSGVNSHGAGINFAGKQLDMENVLMEGNAASGSGGALMVSGSTANVKSSVMRNNSAAGNGGAINMAGGKLTMSGGRIEKNSATLGGALLTFRGNVNLEQVAITGNSQSRGGEIHNNYGKDITLDNENVQMHLDVPNSTGNVSQVTSNGFTLTIDAERNIVILDAEENVVNAVQDATGKRIEAGKLADSVKDLLIMLPLSAIPAPGEDEENPSDTDTTPGDATLVPDAMDTLADTGTTIEDEETPLAGLVSIAQLLEELHQYEGIEDVELPEDFQWMDHEYAQAIYWGLDEALVIDTEDDPLDPDEIVTVALLREVLENFVDYKGADLTVTVEGEDDMIVMDLGERLPVFYGELEAALEGKAA